MCRPSFVPRKKMSMIIHCQRCGKLISGHHNTQYCPDCKKERYKEYQKEYRDQHREELAAKRRERYKDPKTREKEKAWHRSYYEKNRSHCLAYAKDYRANHPLKPYVKKCGHAGSCTTCPYEWCIE